MKGLRQSANLPTESSPPPITTRCTIYCAPPEENGVLSWLISKVAPSAQAGPIHPRAFELEIMFEASRAPVAIACDTEHSGSRTQEEY